MRLQCAVLVASLLLGCASTDTPVQPADAESGASRVFGFVVDASGVCIERASVVVVSGQAVGRTAAQETPCDAWAYGGGFFLPNLVPGAALTLRASAPGYTPAELSVVPVASGPQQAAVVTLAPQ